MQSAFPSSHVKWITGNEFCVLCLYDDVFIQEFLISAYYVPDTMLRKHGEHGVPRLVGGIKQKRAMHPFMLHHETKCDEEQAVLREDNETGREDML